MYSRAQPIWNLIMTVESPEWIDELDEFLMSDDSPDDCLQISELDGFLTGVVIGLPLLARRFVDRANIF